MPIYAYKCSACGFAKDVLQKMSDAPLTECPSCGASAFSKQLTAAGFQLKGSGWYVTDFRDNGAKGPKKAGEGAKAEDGKSEAKSEGKSESSSGEGASAAPAVAAPAPAPAAASAPASSASPAPSSSSGS